MSGMIEAIARAQCEAIGMNPNNWPRKAEEAKAALRAIRKPNRKMLNAAAKAMSPGKRPTPTRVSNAAKHTIRYQAMIDAALGEVCWDDVVAKPKESAE